MIKCITLILIISTHILCDTTSNTATSTISQDAPTKCELIQTAKDLVSKSECFSKVQEIISCMTPCEQQLWVDANLQNTDKLKCFSCDLVKPKLKDCVVKNANGVAGKATEKLKSKRKGLSCFGGFKKDKLKNDADVSKTLDNTLADSIKNNQKGANCFKNMVTGLTNANVKRRRILCLPIADIATMIGSIDAEGKIKFFKYNMDEATDIVNTVVDFSTCNQIVNTNQAAQINEIVEKIANAPSCMGDGPKEGKKPPHGIKVEELNNYLTTLSANSKNYTDLNTAVNVAIANNNTAGNILPGGLPIFVSNIVQTDQKIKKTIFQIVGFGGGKKKDDTDLSKDVVFTIQGGKISCSGSCPEGFSEITFSFVNAEKAPSDYRFWSGVLGGSNFVFGYQTISGKTYTEFRFGGDKKGKKDFDLGKEGMDRVKKCALGSTEATSDPNCPLAGMKQECIKDLNSRCQGSGLNNNAGNSLSLQNGVPVACDANALNVESGSEIHIASCLQFAQDNLMNGMNIKPESISNIESKLSTGGVRLRYLTSETLITKNDPSANNNVFKDSTITSNDVVVDDISQDKALAEINSSGSNTGGDLSSGYLSISILLVFILSLIL